MIDEMPPAVVIAVHACLHLIKLASIDANSVWVILDTHCCFVAELWVARATSVTCQSQATDGSLKMHVCSD